MADGKIEYELTIDALAALASVNSANTGANALADSMGRVATAAENAGRAVGKISSEKLKGLATLAGGLALQVGGAALKANGYDKEAGYLTSAGNSGLQMMLTGAMMGGTKGGMAGLVVGAVAGGAMEYFNQQTAAAQKVEAEASNWLKSVNEIAVGAATASRAISKMEGSKELTSFLKQTEEQITLIQDRSRRGMVDPGIARIQTDNLKRLASEAQARLPGVESTETEARAAKNLAAISASTENIKANREKSAFDNSLDGAKNAAEKVALIDARFAKLTETAAGLADKLSDPAVVTGPEDAAAALLSQIEAIDSELNSLSGRRASTLSGKDLGNESVRSVQTDALTRIGAVLNGGSMTSAANDYARVTSGNTARMVSLLEKISDKPGATSGGAVWAA